eukprot:335355_1
MDGNLEAANESTASFAIAEDTKSHVDQPQNLALLSNPTDSVSTCDMNHAQMVHVLEEYAFDALCDECIDKQRNEIKVYFSITTMNGQKFIDMKARTFKNNIVNHCEGNIEMKESLNKLYETIEQYPEFTQLQSKLKANTEKSHANCSCCGCCYVSSKAATFRVIHRDILPNKLTLKCTLGFHNEDNQIQQNETEIEMAGHLELTTKQRKSPQEDTVCKIEITSDPYNIQCDDAAITALSKGDVLSQIGFGNTDYTLDGLQANDVYKIIKYQPVPFTLAFQRTDAKCMSCVKKCSPCCASKSNKKNKKETQSDKCTQRAFKWMIRFVKQGWPITSKASAIIDTVTDLILLYKASNSGVVLLTMVLFITLLPPYVLSYSSGVQIFLYRKTFQNVQLFTFRSLLLGLYLFPTGIIYFILLDLMDVLAEVYKWIAYGIINKIKTEQELIQIESNIAEYFGMSRMDWISFKKQKLIAQLFFETVPQVILQLYLFLYSSDELRKLSGITDHDLILSIGSAVFNCFVQILRLVFESAAVHETFVQYALNCLTARYEWVPFKHQLDRFVENHEDLLQINYKIQYRLPLITHLTEYMKNKNELEPLRIKYKHKQNRLLFGSVQYDFSKITIGGLSTSIKNLSDRYQSNNKRISITFGGSLRLLDVRSIISLMQCCKEKQIELPDITQIDWHQSFENTPNEQDIRLFSNTFDTDNKSLLISLYLTGYDAQNNYALLKQFVRSHDVPINVADYNGDTILHHMIRRADYDGVYSVLFNLKPRQRFNFHSVNDKGDTIIHEMIKQAHYAELKHLLDIIALQSNGPLNNLGIFNNDGKSAIYLALEQDINTLKAQGKLRTDSMRIQCQMDWLLQSLKESTMEPRKVSEIEQWYAEEEYDSDAIADDVEDEQGSNLFLQLSKEINHFNFVQSNMRMLSDLALILKEKNDNYDQMRFNQIDYQTISNVLHLKLGLMQMGPIDNEDEYERMKERVDMQIGGSDPEQSDVIERDATNALGLRIDSINNEAYEEDIIAASLAKAEEEKSKFNGAKLMHQLLIERNPEIISSQIHRENQQSVLGFMLNKNHLDDIDAYWSEIVDDLLAKDAQILSKEINLLYRLFVYIIRNKSDSIRYLETLHEIIKKCQLLKICDKNGGNNPIHYVISSNMSFTAPILSFLCKTYPEWMMMTNKEGHIPLYLAMENRNTNGFFTLCRFMVQNKVNIKQILKERAYVEKMIEFGSRLLRDGSGAIVIQLLLSVFDYADLFQWTKKHNTFDNDIKSEDISLIKSVSRTGYKQSIEDVLYDKCFLDKEIHDTERFTENDEAKDANVEEPNLEFDINIGPNLDGKKKDSQGDEKEDKEDDLKDEEDVKTIEEDADDDDVDAYADEEELQSVAWIELAYSTLVETFSTLDLVTDIVILSQLYGSKNQWWTSWMLLLLICPYLVSHGSLVVTLKKKIDFNSCCVGFGASLLMTPIALIYLFVIDIVFMIFALVSIVWLFLTAVFVTMCNCKYDANKVSQYDIRDWIDDKIFKQWLDMNRTEIIAYRRLRTLSQLFFETGPQIVLQLRILWVIKWGAGDGNNTFEIDIDALWWSIGLALAHLLLECVFIYLDKCAFKMSFMEYALECLGGRVQWCPFQHLLENVIENQFYICNTSDESTTTVDETNFDAQSYTVRLHDDHRSRAQASLNYEDISANMQCFRYSVSYQFSSQSMNKLIEMIVNCPPMTVPIPFKLLSTTVPIQNIMKSLLCTAEIKIGNSTLSSVDIASVCKLYRACGEKKIDVSVTSDEMNVIQRLLRTDKRNQVIRTLVLEMTRSEIEEHKFEDQLPMKEGDVEIANAIKQTLKSCSESAVIEWITTDISPDRLSDVKLFILLNALSASGDLKLDILRRCYQKRFYVGLDCRVMNKITTIINDCARKCEHDESWYLVIIFILLYSRGRVFDINCINGCCRLSQSIRTALLLQWMPSSIQIGEFKMAYRVFENCGIYRRHIEELFGNLCKNYIMSRDKLQNKQDVVVTDHHKIMKKCKQWDQFKGQTAAYIKETVDKLLHQFEGQEFDDENIALLDELIMELQMSSNYNKYLDQTLQYRERLTNSVDIEIEAKTNTITAIGPKQLITHRDFDHSERFQICEMSFTSDQNNPNFRIFFDENVSDINNKIFLWNTNGIADGEDEKQNLIFIDTDNVGLDRYNYYLLHSPDAIPSLMIESPDDCSVTIDVLYTAMYRHTSHRRLDEIRAKMEDDAEKALEEITKLDMNAYRFGRTLGSGASCRVVEGHNKLDGMPGLLDVSQMVAIKIMDKGRPVIKKLFNREVNILHALTPDISNPPKGILPFMGYGEDDDSYYVVTRLLTGGELFDRIVSKDDKYKITEKIAVKLALAMLEGIKYCHDNNIVHRDVKPENWVFANKGIDSDLVLIDFGCARIVSDDEIVDDVVGTAYYLSPELSRAALANYRKKGASVQSSIPEPEPRTGRILKASDVWSIGVVAYVMMTGRAPFRGRNNIAIFESTCLQEVKFPEKDARYHNLLSLNEHFKDFILKILVKDPSQRMSIEDAMRHPWIQGVDASDYRLNKDVLYYLKQFTYQSKLKKEVTRVLASNMGAEPAKQVLRHFNRLDADGDGYLNVQELTLMLLDMGYVRHTAEEEARKMIMHGDSDQDGVLDFEEFKGMWFRKVLTSNDQYIHRVFDVFDDNGDGVIDAKELAQIIAPEAYNDDEEGEQDIELMKTIERMIDEVDANGDKVIDFEEFKKAMQEELDSGKSVFGGDQEAHGGFIGKKI